MENKIDVSQCEFHTDVGGCMLAEHVSHGYKTITNFKCKYNNCHFKEWQKEKRVIRAIANYMHLRDIDLKMGVFVAETVKEGIDKIEDALRDIDGYILREDQIK